MKRFIYILLFSSLGFLAFKAEDYFEIAKNLDIFAEVYKEVNTTYVDEVKPGELIRAAIDGMLNSLDPYTNFYSEAQSEDYRYQVTGTYAGIGSTIRRIDNYVYVESPLEDFPAHKVGLLPGDKILAVDGEDMKGKKTSEVTEYLKGQAGTTLELKIERLGEGTLTKTITRENIKMKNVPYYGIIEDGIGYVKLTSFTTNAGKEVRDAVVEMKQQGANKIVLDLRNNGGGLLHEAIQIVNIFVPRGETIVMTRGKFEEDNRSFKTQNGPVDTEIPLAVLINESSASASEIVSGALQDLDRAILVGRNSFGKGLVQTTKRLTYNTSMKITTAKYYIPSGRLIQRLDYEHKINGKAVAVADSVKQQYTTRNGRIVTDAEGIQPDALVDNQKYSEVAQALVQNNHVFHFANVYRSKHPTAELPMKFDISEEVYAEFKTYLNDKAYEYTTRTEQNIEMLEKQAKKDNYFVLLDAELAKLKTAMSSTKKNDLENHKQELKEILEYEIIKRYYFEQGKVEIAFDDDKDWAKVKELLNDTNKLNKLLNN